MGEKSDREYYDEKFDNIQRSLDKFYISIFEGENGEPGLKTQVHEHGRILSCVMWFVGVIVSALIWLGIEVHFKK